MKIAQRFKPREQLTSRQDSSNGALRSSSPGHQQFQSTRFKRSPWKTPALYTFTAALLFSTFLICCIPFLWHSSQNFQTYHTIFGKHQAPDSDDDLSNSLADNIVASQDSSSPTSNHHLTSSPYELQPSHVLYNLSWVSVDITPNYSIWLSGFSSRNASSQGVLQHLFLKILVMDSPSSAPSHQRNARASPNSSGDRSSPGGVGQDMDKTKPMLFLTWDLIGIYRETTERILKALQAHFQLPRTNIVMAFSHSHSSPIVGNNLKVLFYEVFQNPERRAEILAYEQELVQNVVCAVAKVTNIQFNRNVFLLQDHQCKYSAYVQIQRYQPAIAFYGQGYAPLAVNRRQVREKEFVENQTYGKVDHTVPFLCFIQTPKEIMQSPILFNSWYFNIMQQPLKPSLIMLGYAAHGTVLTTEYTLSADYMGYAIQALSNRFPNSTSLFFAGCSGDQNIYPRGSISLAVKHGTALGQAVAQRLEDPSQLVLLEAEFMCRATSINLPLVDVITKKDLEALPSDYDYELLPVPESLKSTSQFFASPRKYIRPWIEFQLQHSIPLLERISRSWNEYPYPIQVCQFGKDMKSGKTRLSWVFLAGEAVIDYSLMIKTAVDRFNIPTQNVWITAYANDVMAYVPSSRVQSEGGYEAGERSTVLYGMPGKFGKNIDRVIVKSVLEMIVP